VHKCKSRLLQAVIKDYEMISLADFQLPSIAKINVFISTTILGDPGAASRDAIFWGVKFPSRLLL